MKDLSRIKNSAHIQVVEKALSYMRANLSAPITIPIIAKAVFYSAIYLRVAFKKVTGESVIFNLTQLRLEAAKQLLAETELSITQIGESVGIPNPAYFTRIFKDFSGVNPSSFRKTRRESFAAMDPVSADPKPRHWLRDDFSSASLQRWWQPLHGQCIQDNQCLRVRNGALGLTKPLPENFSIEFQVKIDKPQGDDSVEFHLILGDNAWSNYFKFTLGAHENKLAEFSRQNHVLLRSSDATVTEEKWHKIRLEIEEDVLHYFMDGREIFLYQEPFPSEYEKRSNIVFGSYSSKLSIRDFCIQNKGLSNYVRTIRQGDSLFKAELFERAEHFYKRRLEEAGLSTLESMELHCKMGICGLRRNDMENAKNEFLHLAKFPQKDFWTRQATVGLLEILWKEGNTGSFVDKCRILAKDSFLHENIRELAEGLAENAETLGFYNQALSLRELVFESEAPRSFSSLLEEMSLANILHLMNRFHLAEHHYREISESPLVSSNIAGRALISLAFVLTMQGKTGESDCAIARFAHISKSTETQAQVRIHRAYNLRAKGQTPEALAELNEVIRQYPNERQSVAFAGIHKAFIYCSLGEGDQGSQAMLQAEKSCPEFSYFSKGRRSNQWYAVHLAQKDYAQARDILLQDALRSDGQKAFHAEQMLKAGIMEEFMGNVEKAKQIWLDASRRFPQKSCCYFGELARRLALNETENWEEMPYHAQTRSENFYLAALLYEKREEHRRARELFEMSVKEDPSLRWPAYLAQQKLLKI